MIARYVSVCLVLILSGCAGYGRSRRIVSSEVLPRIESKLRSAEGIAIRFRGEFSTPPGEDAPIIFHGTLRLKSGNRVHLAGTRETEGSALPITLICDGKRVRVTGNGFQPVERAAPPLLNRNMRIGFARAGALFTVDALVTWILVDAIGVDRVDFRRVFVPGVDWIKLPTAGHDVLAYDLRNGVAGNTMHCRLWYDSRSDAPARRTISWKEGNRSRLVTEAYQTWAISSAIPDRFFVLDKK